MVYKKDKIEQKQYMSKLANPLPRKSVNKYQAPPKDDEINQKSSNSRQKAEDNNIIQPPQPTLQSKNLGPLDIPKWQDKKGNDYSPSQLKRGRKGQSIDPVEKNNAGLFVSLNDEINSLK